MRKRLTRREKRSRNKKIVLMSSICLLLCLCVGYAAFNTQLSLRAKGNIKQKKAADMLLENVVDSGDGLYKDIYEEGRYFYKGANPNNYIKFNNELWRILSVEADGSLKILKVDSLNASRINWDESGGSYGSNLWARPADLNNNLNNDYYNKILESEKNKIIQHDWYVGQIVLNNDNLIEQIDNEKSSIWNGNIALISLSEYIRANSNDQCNSFKKADSSYECCKTNYLCNLYADSYWTISTSENNNVIYLYGGYYISVSSPKLTGMPEPYVRPQYAVFPTLYITSDIVLNGEGTSSNPYQITN